MLTAGLSVPVTAEALPQTQTVQAININAEGAEHLHDGYASVDSWNQVKQEKIDTFNSLKEEIHNLGSYVDSETMAELDGIDTTTFKYIEDVENQITKFTEVKTQAEQAKAIAEADAKRRAMTYQQTSSSTNYSYGGGNGNGLTAQSGVNYYNGRKETYYNLDMSGVINNAQAMGIQGNYWVRDDGVKMYGDYVIVASQDAKGTIVDTSLGTGITLDYCPAGTVDVATNW